jgi:hypothetical protein
MPRWARLLDQWRLEGRLGLTLSFLVGALLPPDVNMNRERAFAELHHLPTAMRDEAAPYGMVARIYKMRHAARARCESLVGRRLWRRTTLLTERASRQAVRVAGVPSRWPDLRVVGRCDVELLR